MLVPAGCRQKGSQNQTALPCAPKTHIPADAWNEKGRKAFRESLQLKIMICRGF